MSQLETLGLDHNQLSAFPVQITQLPALNLVDVSYNCLNEATLDPQVVTYLKQNNPGVFATQNTFCSVVSPNCGDADVLIEQYIYNSTANEICTATTRLTAGPGVLVSSGATVAYYSPLVVLKPGFRAALGSSFMAQPVIPGNSVAFESSPEGIEDLANKLTAAPVLSNTSKLTLDSVLETIAQHPPLINGISLDPKQLTSLDFDSEGLFWVFATTQAFVAADQNGQSDIYRYAMDHNSVMLISRTPEALSGQGGSYYPVMDEQGRFIVFHSQANNLVTNDNNMGSDIFVYDNESETLEKLSVAPIDQAITDFTHPALDRAGQTLLYVAQVGEASSSILAFNSLTQAATAITEDSNKSYYFPAISYDGQYQAYLMTSEDQEHCTVHWIDRQSGLEADSDCGNLAINPQGLLHFNNNDMLEWRDSLWQKPVVTIVNPFE